MPGLIFWAILILPGWAAGLPDGHHLSYPPYPVIAFKHHDQGTVTVSVSFGPDGTVTDCHVVRSTATAIMDRSTCNFIERNWHSQALARQTGLIVPITYLLPGNPPPVIDFPPPPMFAAQGQAVTIILNVTFGADGWAKKCSISRSSGHSRVDAETARWALTHFHHQAYAGLTISVPLQFIPDKVPVAKKG